MRGKGGSEGERRRAHRRARVPTPPAAIRVLRARPLAPLPRPPSPAPSKPRGGAHACAAARLRLRDSIYLLQRVRCLGEGLEGGELDHLAKARQVGGGRLHRLGARSDLILRRHLQQRIPRGRLEQQEERHGGREGAQRRGGRWARALVVPPLHELRAAHLRPPSSLFTPARPAPPPPGRRGCMHVRLGGGRQQRHGAPQGRRPQAPCHRGA